MQHDVHSVHRPHNVKMFSVSNQPISVSVGNPFFKNHFATGQNLAGATVKQPLLGGIPVSAPHSLIPTVTSIAGMTEPWYAILSLRAYLMSTFTCNLIVIWNKISYMEYLL